MTANRQEHERNAVVWMFLQLGGPVLAFVGVVQDVLGGGQGIVSGGVAAAVGLTTLVVTPCLVGHMLGLLARDKGPSSAWGIAALLGPVGVLVLNCLPNRVLRRTLDSLIEPTQDQP